MTKYLASMIRAVTAAILAFALMAGSVQAKAPTLKEKLSALAGAGKSIPVVYWPCQYVGVNWVAEGSKGFRDGVIPGDYAALRQTVIDCLNQTFSNEAFKAVGLESVALKPDAFWGKAPDWASLDSEMVVSVAVFLRYDFDDESSTTYSLKLEAWAEIKFNENGLDKKRKMKSTTLKTLTIRPEKKTVRAFISDSYTREAEFERTIPPATLAEVLKAEAVKSIAKFFAK